MKKRLSGKECKLLNKEIAQRYHQDDFLKKTDRAELSDDVISVNGQPVFFKFDDKLVPTLQLLLKNPLLPKVAVDMPAVPFMIKGADVMRPGIKDMDEFDKGDFVVVVDQNHGKPLAVGVALFGKTEIKAMERGKVLHNIHYIGDKIWKGQY